LARVDSAEPVDKPEATLDGAISIPVLIKVGPDSFQTGAHTECILQVAGDATVVPNHTQDYPVVKVFENLNKNRERFADGEIGSGDCL
jgi:hypothetical protein